MAPSNTSPLARFKADSSSTPNTPSSIKLSPLTILSQVGSWFSHSPVTNSPRKTEADFNNSPKSTSPANAGIATKKVKEKTRGPANACTSPIYRRCNSIPIPIQLDDAPEGKFRWKATRPSTATIEPKHVCDPDAPYRCIICDNEIPKAERERHFHGRPHSQTFGMLKDFKKRYVVKEKDLPKPDSRLLRVNKNEWRCPPCDESMPYPHKAKTMQDHLAMTAHKLAMEGLWVAFVRHMRSAFGLRDDEIPEFPQHLDDTIPQKPRDNGN
jgi:hypothetical protein